MLDVKDPITDEPAALARDYKAFIAPIMKISYSKN